MSRKRREATEAATLAKKRSIALSAPYLEGDIGTEAEYYRAHYGKAVFYPDHVDTIVRRLRVHFTPDDIVNARAADVACFRRRSTQEVAELERADAGHPWRRDFVPVECSRHVAEAVSGARLVVLHDCGHFSYLERPAELYATIADFISQRRKEL